MNTRCAWPRSRQAAAEAAAAGRVEEAVAAAEALAPGALAAQPAVLFRLQCQRFLELVRRARPETGLPGLLPHMPISGAVGGCHHDTGWVPARPLWVRARRGAHSACCGLRHRLRAWQRVAHARGRKVGLVGTQGAVCEPA